MDPNQLTSTLDERNAGLVSLTSTRRQSTDTMVMDAMRISVVPGLLARVHSLMQLCQEVPIHQYRCQLLALHLSGLIPFLQGIKTSQAPIPPSADNAFNGLMFALIRAHTVFENIIQCPKLRLMFSHAQHGENIINCSKILLEKISALSLIQFKISTEKEEQIRHLQSKVDMLERDAAPNKDEHDFEAEVTEVLRAHNTGEATSSAGSGRVMDHLLQWLAKRFDSDVETVRREWQEMKEETLFLRQEIEYTVENKRTMEEEFLRQVMVYIDRDAAPEQVPQPTFAVPESGSGERSRETPAEFLCSICYEMMEDPVVCESGHTFCRGCITKWYTDAPGNDTCPLNRTKVANKSVFENIALRTLIQRWKDTGSICSEGQRKKPVAARSQRDGVPSAPSEPRSGMEISRDPSKGKSARKSPPLPSPPVVNLISSLQSQRSVEIRRSLRELTSIALHSSGQLEIYMAQGVPIVSMLLKSNEHLIVEKAADVLDAMTFEVKGEDHEPLSYEDREQIWTAVSDCALDSLIFIMDNGSQAARLKAAQTVVNLLSDDEIRQEVSRRKGVVTAFFGLTNIAPAVFTGGTPLCIKGFTLLCGEKASGSIGDMALTNSLIRLAGLGGNSQIVEEALMALSSLMETTNPVDCSKWVGRSTILFFVRCISRSPKPSSLAGGHSPAQSGMLTDVAKTEVLKILNVLSLAEGIPSALIESQLVPRLLPKVTDLDAGECFVRQAIKLLWRCILSTKDTFLPSFFQIDFQLEMTGLVNIFKQENTLADTKLDLISMLGYLCKENEPLRLSFFSVGGVAALEILVDSPVVAVREEVARLVRRLAEFHPRQRELRTRGATMLLTKLLADDRLECRCQAVVALYRLIKPNDWVVPFEHMPFERLVDLLHPTYASECREAAVGILLNSRSSFALRSSDVNTEKKSIELLLDVIRHDLGADAKKGAAELLITHAIDDQTNCSAFEAEGLLVLTQFGMQQGGQFRDKVVQLLSAFCQESDDTRNYVMEVGGVVMLVDALERGKMKSEAVSGLRSLVTYIPTRDCAIRAGFIEKAIHTIQSGSGRTGSTKLIEALAIILDNNRNSAETIRNLGGVQALYHVLTGADVDEKKVAASALVTLIRSDVESRRIFVDVARISCFKNLLREQVREAEQEDALELLNVAVDNLENAKILLKEDYMPLLVSILSNASPEVEELVLQVLLKLSRQTLNDNDPLLYSKFMLGNLPCQMFRVVHTDSTSTEEAVQIAIRIIRNISLIDSSARAVLLQEGDGVVKVLLGRLRRHEADGSSQIVHFASVALERFMLEGKGRSSLIEAQGIPLLLRILFQVGTPGQAKGFVARILVMVAENDQSSKEVCSAIFDVPDVVPGLKDILQNESRSDCKSQAAILLRYLIRDGPRADVCRSIRDSGCIPKLMDLKADPDCVEAASSALETLHKYDRDIKKQSMLWFRSPRASQ
ncbi:hypothetical protein Mapa_004556 [Marchantia paleacea]|nr:hypothetical protein Mapa_004556 [Marchantia paleacea]